MFDYAHLKALSVVVSQGGFDKAAKHLYISQSAVSQRIKQLEEKVGQSLLVRSNPIRATETGKRLLRHYAQVQLLESELRSEMDVDDPSLPTIVKIAVNADSLATWFLPALADTFKQHKWLLELIVDDEAYTHHLLKNGEAVGCVTTTQTALSGCSSEFLGNMEYLCVATPQFIQTYFTSEFTVNDITQAPAVVFSTKDKLHDKFLNFYFDIKDKRWREHKIPSSESFLEAIKMGLGYGLVAQPQAKALLDNGELVEIFPDKRMHVPLYWQHWNIKAKQTSVIYRALAASAKHVLNS
ncbi:transcriptional regulator, LysR family [Shewanella halifaxensis HAW-EB4]|uniref:Transcriptional regulator, LysR family n=1 Tax=Shewanella halifaxensis (strain HAW-EB4) TaxID=458817 RepID=B0TVJ9_SHEHH|nr:LysR family transcriptional regulator ArgP [Shewanella halifaxensis]ABZ76884.1 transcriptional regulator, LysR family [Shewanella halifaxensis HAW-EB4]